MSYFTYDSRLFQIGFPMAMRSLRVSSKISARIQRAVSETGKEKYCMASGETALW